MDAGNGLTIVNIEELPSNAWIIDLGVAAALRETLLVQLEASKLTPEDAFRRFDTSGDGRLDKAEFDAALEYLNEGPLEEAHAAEIERAFVAIDTDGDGTWTIEEFVRWAEQHRVTDDSCPTAKRAKKDMGD